MATQHSRQYADDAQKESEEETVKYYWYYYYYYYCYYYYYYYYYRTCQNTASRSPVLSLGGICVPPTVNYLQYLATVSTLTAAVHFQSPAPKSGRLTRPSVQSVSDVCLKRICSLDTSAFSALELLDDYCAI